MWQKNIQHMANPVEIHTNSVKLLHYISSITLAIFSEIQWGQQTETFTQKQKHRSLLAKFCPSRSLDEHGFY